MIGQIDPLSEKPIPIKVFCKDVPGRDGKSIHWMTLGRWCRQGIRGVVLESLLVGNQLCTTHAAFARFVEAVTRAANGERPIQAIGSRTRREKNRAVRDALAELAAAGF